MFTNRRNSFIIILVGGIVMETINKRVFFLREKLGLNQEDFGGKIAIVRSGISNIENEVRKVNERTIKLICQEFNVNEDWLRFGIGKMFNENADSILIELTSRYQL